MRCIILSGATVPFTSLIEAVNDDFIATLKGLGYTEIFVQYGHAQSAFKPSPGVTGFDFRPAIAELVHTCDLVITHAGSGSILDSLERGFGPSDRKIIVVINSALMDNHQAELAHKLRDLGCVMVVDEPKLLKEALTVSHNRNFSKLAPARSLAEALDELK